MSLTNKYRPMAFSEVIGQKSIEILKSYIGKPNIPGLWIFHGTKGTGKTSTARIFSLALNCKNLSKDREPCLACENCLDILNNVSDMMIEMDGASNRGIDDIRRLQGIITLRSRGTKVIVIDECHMLTESASNSLLKVTEEPPKNVIIILVTTNVDKIISTIRDRAIQIKFDRASDVVLQRHLRNLARIESIDSKLSSDAADLIIKKADGSVRGMVKGLDVFMSLVFEGKESEFCKVYSGVEEEKYQVELVKSFLGRKINYFSDVVRQMQNEGMTAQEILFRLYSGCLSVALREKGLKGVKGGEELVDVSMSREQYMWLSNKVPSWSLMLKEYPDYNLLVKLCLEFFLVF